MLPQSRLFPLRHSLGVYTTARSPNSTVHTVNDSSSQHDVSTITTRAPYINIHLMTTLGAPARPAEGRKIYRSVGRLIIITDWLGRHRCPAAIHEPWDRRTDRQTALEGRLQRLPRSAQGVNRARMSCRHHFIECNSIPSRCITSRQRCYSAIQTPNGGSRSTQLHTPSLTILQFSDFCQQS